MDGGNEQRVVIRFCDKVGLYATETLVLVQKAYENEALNHSNAFRWLQQFTATVLARFISDRIFSVPHVGNEV